MNFLLSVLEKKFLSTRLLIGFGTLVLVVLSIGFFGLYNQHFLNQEVHKVYDSQLLGISHLKEVQINFAHMGRLVRQFALTQDANEREQIRQDLVSAETNMRKSLELARPRLLLEESRLDLAQFETLFAKYKLNVEKTIALHDRGKSSAAEANALLVSQDFQLTALEANQKLAVITRMKEENALASVESAQAAFEVNRNLTWLLLAGGLGFSLFFGILVGRSILRPTDEMRLTVEQLAAGKLDLLVPHTDYTNEIGQLARSIKVLQSEAQQMEVQRWIKTYQASITSELQGASSFVDLSQRFFSTLGMALQLGQGAFYIYEEGARRLRLLGGYAWQERKNLGQYFALGQGLVGQCALERSPIIIRQAPADYLCVHSSLGSSLPGRIMVLPVINNGRLLAVIELALLDAFGENEQTLLEGVMPMLAMSLESLERSAQTKMLLERTQAQAESVEQQASRLEGQTMELEAKQAALQETEAWYRSIIESAPDGMLVCDAEGKIILVNPELASMFGYEPDELLGLPVETLVPVALREQHSVLRDNYLWESQASRGMGGDRSNLQGIRKDGSLFAVEVGLSRLPALGERGVCVCAAVRDVTERKLMESAVRDSELRMRNVLENSPAGVAIVSGEGKQIFSNERLANLFGVSHEEMKSRRSSEFWAKSEERVRFMELMNKDGFVSNFEAKFRRANGDLLTVLLTSSMVEMTGGRYIVSWFYDITDLKNAETALEKLTNFQQNLIDTMPYPIFYKGPDARFLGFNRAYEDSFGVKREELIGKKVLELDYLPIEDRRLYQAEDEAIIAQASQVQREMPMTFADGKLHETLYFVSGFRHSDGQAGGLVGTFVDITPMKDAERMSTEARLRAEEATRAKSDFLANMSHEIRTPMNTIIGMSHLALQGELSLAQREYIEKVNRSGERLLRLIDDILDFSRIENAQLALDQVEMNFAEVLKDFVEKMTTRTVAKGLLMQVQIAPDVPASLRGDQVRLSQLLEYLGDNAVKFTNHGEVILAVNVVDRDSELITLHFSLRDTGIGMTPQQCSQLFMPFAQVDGSASRKYGGTGIGLAMASKLAELMDGRIWVDSELGQGSVFHVELRFGLTQSTACILLDEKSKEEQVLATAVTPALASETPLPDLENELDTLLVYLQDSDSEAVHLVNSIAEQLKNSVHASAFTAVRLAVKNFDFDLALNALQEFRRTLNKVN